MTHEPLFAASASIEIDVAPEQVLGTVSDLPRSGQWSQECRGGEWVSGRPGAVGSVFRGENHRAEDVVAWAPVVRGTWFTEAEVVTSTTSRFAWAMRTRDGAAQESVWSFEVEPGSAGGTVLTHAFWMGTATEGIRGIVADLDERTEEEFFVEWGHKVEADLVATLRRVRDVVEEDAAVGRARTAWLMGRVA